MPKFLFAVFFSLVAFTEDVGASETLREAQRLLNSLGYNAGPVDGVWGNKTQTAFQTFYKQRGIFFDGSVDQQEIEDLKSATMTSQDNAERFYSDQPDQNSDYKVHFNYIVFKDGEDRKRDLTGELQTLVETANKSFFRAAQKNKYSNDVGKRFKLDYTDQGNLDITFIKVEMKIRDLDGDFNLYLADVLTKRNMNDPKKVYFNFVEAVGPQGGSGGVGIAHINLQRSSTIKRPEFMLLHELLHTQGMGFKCNRGVFKDYQNNHVSTQNHLIGEYTAAVNLNGYIYDSQDEKCPSLKDSVYLTPTSEEPYDPYAMICLRRIGKYKHPTIMDLMLKQNRSLSYYKNRFSTSCQWKRYLPNVFYE